MAKINGIQIDIEPPDLINQYKGRTLLILGSGLNVWSEFDAIKRKEPNADVMCINFSFVGLEWLMRTNQVQVQHWVSLHAEHFALRDIYFKDHGIKTHGKVKFRDYVDYVWFVNREGSGGLFALKIALLLGYSKIILVGMPMDNTRRFYDHPAAECQFQDPALVLAWKDFPGYIGEENAKKISGMSGMPREIFGGPR